MDELRRSLKTIEEMQRNNVKLKTEHMLVINQILNQYIDDKSEGPEENSIRKELLDDRDVLKPNCEGESDNDGKSVNTDVTSGEQTDKDGESSIKESDIRQEGPKNDGLSREDSTFIRGSNDDGQSTLIQEIQKLFYDFI